MVGASKIVRDITEQLAAIRATERHSRQLSIINRVFQVASEPIGLERVLDALLSEICDVFNADAMDIYDHILEANPDDADAKVAMASLVIQHPR